MVCSDIKNRDNYEVVSGASGCQQVVLRWRLPVYDKAIGVSGLLQETIGQGPQQGQYTFRSSFTLEDLIFWSCCAFFERKRVSWSNCLFFTNQWTCTKMSNLKVLWMENLFELEYTAICFWLFYLLNMDVCWWVEPTSLTVRCWQHLHDAWGTKCSHGGER
jgi:hypothetical protein